MNRTPSPRSYLKAPNRRDFLKLAMAGVAGLFLSKSTVVQAASDETQGRVIDNGVSLFTDPSFRSLATKTFWKDNILPIAEVTVGDDEPAYNRVWYAIRGGGYVHSGRIQPVNTRLNQPVKDLPITGALAEVTVPFTDAHWKPTRDYPVAYRFYYETTHWVVGLATAEDGTPWYRIQDDKWDITYYAPAQHLRIIPSDELTPFSPEVPAAAKRIEVRTAEQMVVAYERERVVFVTRAATGAKFSNGNFATPPGRHSTFHKRPHRHMAAGNLAYNGYDLPGVPWVSYITKSGISFHGTYWHNDYGRPRSHGCINLTPKAAKWIYRWTLPVVPPGEHAVYEDFGTIVDVV